MEFIDPFISCIFIDILLLITNFFRLKDFFFFNQKVNFFIRFIGLSKAANKGWTWSLRKLTESMEGPVYDSLGN